MNEYLKEFHLTIDQYDSLEGKIRIQLDDNVFTHSFRNIIKHKINLYRSRHHLRKPNPFVENLLFYK